MKLKNFDFKNPRSYMPLILLALAVMLVVTFGIKKQSPYLKTAMENVLNERLKGKELMFNPDDSAAE